ncbi:Proton/glutamate-aspartate symporter [Pseudoclavibacter triregionum]|nr:Proton/glutamate-aspartate symporter [Pseudoclavibacter triregionum]
MTSSTTPPSAADADPAVPSGAAAAPRRRLRIPFSAWILIGLAAGVLLGLAAVAIGKVPAADGSLGPNWLTVTLQTVGSSFVTLLKAIVPPLIFLAVVSSISQLRGVANAASLAWKTLLWFGITALIAVVVGIAVGLVLQPGAGQIAAGTPKAPSTTGGWFDFLRGLVPGNFLGLGASMRDEKPVLSFDALQVLVISIAVGIAALKVGEKAKPFLALSESLLAIVQKVLWWIILLAPIGTAGLIGNAVASYGWSALGSLGTFVVAIVIGIAIIGFVVYPILAKLHGLSVRRFLSGVWPAVALGFASRSSLGTMPVTRAVAIENLGVPKAYASFAVPLGATTKMDGCAAIYPAIAAIFVANFYGIQLEPLHYALIALVSVLGSAATAGVTGATVMLTLTLSTLGLPLEGVGLLLAVDPIIDMLRTALNVAGQALVPAIVAKREGILDQAVYDAPDAFEGLGDDEPAGDAIDVSRSDEATDDVLGAHRGDAEAAEVELAGSTAGR